jgi:NADH:ubiquinone oxidoreductase subunit C
MTNEELKQYISALFPTVSYDETGEFLNILIASPELKPIIQTLRNDDALKFNFLFCLTCIDWKTNLMMVYHLISKTHKHIVVIKAKIADIVKPEIETVCDIYQTANFHEREVYDLFGVNFKNHPDMRRLLLDESWEGYPLRKNYVDENMITI